MTAGRSGEGSATYVLPPLEVLKALGDDSRRRIYELLAAAAAPLSTAEVAGLAGLHPNTVRPHLERLREAGLVEVVIASTGSVGRPQHRYRTCGAFASTDAAQALLCRSLLSVAADAGIDGDDMVDLGREQGRRDGAAAHGDALAALEAQQQRLGFAPTVTGRSSASTMAFGHCPFRELAEERPDLVCALHSGLVAGLVDEVGDCAVRAFYPLVEREPCRVDLVAR